MTKTLATFLFILTPFFLFSQKDSSCDWTIKLESIHKLNNKLVVIKKHIENSCFPLVIVDGYPLSKDSSTYPFNYPQIVMSHIEPEKIESLVLLKGESAKKLYGSASKNGVVVISLKKERHIKQIKRTIFKELNNKS